MGKISVSELAPGMVLAEDLVTPGGRFLMPKGTSLGRSHLKSLAGWGINEVDVLSGGDGDESASAPQVSEPEEERPAETGGPTKTTPEDFLEDAKRAAIDRFRHTDLNHDAMGVLFKLFVVRTAKRMAKKQAAGIAEDATREIPKIKPDEETGEIPTPDDILREDPQLVSLPEVFIRINAVLKDPNKSMNEAADVISMDPSLSAKLLKLVNSAFYGRAMRAVQQRFPAKVDNLNRAVMIVGGKQLTTLALGISVLPIFQDIPREYIDMKSFWMHSIACGVIARGLAAKIHPGNEESYFVAGLLHDIGRLIMYKHVPALSGLALNRARKDGVLLVEAEREIFSWDHAKMGGLLLRKWQYPEVLEKLVRHHHDLADPLGVNESAVIHVADIITNAMEVGSSGERYVPALNPAAWDALGIDADDLKVVISEVGTQIGEIFRSFFPEEVEAA